MVFTSHVFLFYFLPLVLGVYYLLPFRARTALIAVSSYVFYGWANPVWAAIMFFGSSVDYVCGIGLLKLSGLPDEPGGLPPVIGREVPRTRAMKALLVISIVTNLGLLAVFKYTGFVGREPERARARARRRTGRRPRAPHRPARRNLLLHVQGHELRHRRVSRRRAADAALHRLSLLRGVLPRSRRRADHPLRRARGADAGPRAHARQVRARRRLLRVRHGEEDADRESRWGTSPTPRSRPARSTRPTRGSACVGYAFQIYFDFSGYSDMACGLALMLGFVLIQNFDSPYQADSITDFWRRWHISLSTWLRDYLYIPLGGNRLGERRTYVNLMAVMLLGGLWHGASWNFVLWGAIHGGMLAFERAQGKDSAYRRLPRPSGSAITFFVVCLSWVFFRAKTLGQAVSTFKSLFGFASVTAASDAPAGMMYTRFHVTVFVLAALLVWEAPNTWTFTSRLSAPRAIAALGAAGPLDPDDVDAEREPVPLLPILSPAPTSGH